MQEIFIFKIKNLTQLSESEILIRKELWD